MLKNWRTLKVGDTVHFYGKEFDGAWDDICTVIEVKDDCVLVDDNGITLTIEDWSMDMFRK